MTCTKCGKKLDDNASFCGSCGNKQIINEQNESNQTDNSSNHKNSNKYNFNNEDFQNIIITPAKKVELFAFLKKVAIILLGIFIFLVIIPTILVSVNKPNFNIKKSVLIEYKGNDISIMTPKNATEIGEWAFYDKKFIKTITLDENVTKISTGAFEGCTSLAMITIPENVTEIGDWILAECWSLATVRVKSGSYADAWARTYNFHSNINIEYY